MSQPIHVDILSDDEDDCFNADGGISTPIKSQPPKRLRSDFSQQNPNLVILVDDATPQKPSLLSLSPTPSFVADTPFSDLSKLEGVSTVKCTAGPSNPVAAASNPENKFSGISQFICLESDDEPEDDSSEKATYCDVAVHRDFDTGVIESSSYPWNESFTHIEEASQPVSLEEDEDDLQTLSNSAEDNDRQILHHHDLSHDEEILGLKEDSCALKYRSEGTFDGMKRKNTDGIAKKKKMTKEERALLIEERKLKREQLKLQKAALKAEAAQKKKLEKEVQKWEKGKLAVNSIVAEIDTRVVEIGSLGGHLLTRLSEKGLKYRITSNPVGRSVFWTMNIPEEISQFSTKGQEIRYVLLLYEAEEFCKLVNSGSLKDYIYDVQMRYPSHTLCILTNRLMSHIDKREQEHYKNPNNKSGWQRPPVEELFADLATHFNKVHTRMCIDEAEVAEHVAGLTASLANCQFRKGLTRLSVSANGSIIPKDCVDRNIIKQNSWLKALIAIPKVQPRFAIAIWKRYPTMKSLLSVYIDPMKSVHDKEFLLKDLTVEGLVGGDRRLGEICSKRVYRVLMAQNGSIKTDDVEDGADCFRY